MRGGVLLEFALGLGVLTSLLIALVELGRVLWQILLWVGLLSEVTRATTLCGEGTLQWPAVAALSGLPADGNVFTLGYSPVGCSLGTCEWTEVTLHGHAVSTLENAWWPVVMPDIQLSAQRQSREIAGHPFCPS
jgi:hypothetical protein